jgi:hypothetical protein
MPNEMKIDAALADLGAGKFSFRMVDAIKNHIQKLECELDVTRSLHASAVRDLKLQEYANWRLESELKSLNARIHALIRTNILTEKAYRMMRPIAIEVGKYFIASSECAGAGLEIATANLKSCKFQSQLVGSFSKLHDALRSIGPTGKTFQEIRTYAIKLGEHLQVLERHAATAIARTTAHLSNLNKTSS